MRIIEVNEKAILAEYQKDFYVFPVEAIVKARDTIGYRAREGEEKGGVHRHSVIGEMFMRKLVERKSKWYSVRRGRKESTT